jgi:hypothetical protein
MSSRTWFLLIVVLFLLLLFKPGTLWAEMKRIWSQREIILRFLVIIVGLYFLYGVYRLYSQGMLPLPW